MNPLDIMKKFRSVKRIQHQKNLDPSTRINFLFFICPRMKAPGFVIEKGVLSARYVPGLSGFAAARISKAQKFLDEARTIGIDHDIQAIYADADSFLLFRYPVKSPAELPTIQDIPVKSNLEFYRGKMSDISRLDRDTPWQNIPARHLEEQRIKKFLPTEAPRQLKEEFVKRVFIGFALDGLIIREGVFGANPVILGVESPGVSMLQNSALFGGGLIPIVELD